MKIKNKQNSFCCRRLPQISAISEFFEFDSNFVPEDGKSMTLKGIKDVICAMQ